MAIEGFTGSLAHELEAFNVRVKLIEPGYAPTTPFTPTGEPRTLTRWCRQELGESPASLVRCLRVEEAQRLLEQTSLPPKNIAARSANSS
jgi:NAD(P)-dependent dehydrogenase (short-subunit alcohol dehydrogenase family)